MTEKREVSEHLLKCGKYRKLHISGQLPRKKR